MKYFVRLKGKKSKAHIWLDEDTVFRMASTGGLKVSRYEVRDDTGGREVCHMCKHISEMSA